MAWTILIDCKGLESEKIACQTAWNCHEEVWNGTLCGADNVFFSFFCGSCEKNLFWKLVCTWPIGDQTAAETLWRNVLCADTKKWVTVDLFVNVSTKLCMHIWSLAQPLAWSEINPALRATELQQNQTSKDLSSSVPGKDPSAWRLVCEWVCAVTSVSVRIEKRAKCAKNNKPKSGGLFLANARPFPQHSSSIATFSAERAWLEAIQSHVCDQAAACKYTGSKWRQIILGSVDCNPFLKVFLLATWL